jgi:uncharacterized repeat protein (TIGR01451 family)
MVKRFVCSLPVVLVSCLLFVGAASAVTPGAGFTIASVATPTNFSAGDNAGCESEKGESLGPLAKCDAYQVTVTNRGSVATREGAPITITDVLPAGLTVQQISLLYSGDPASGFDHGEEDCSMVSVRCEFPEALGPDETLRMTVRVTVNPGAAGSLTDTASVSGGGVTQASTSVQNTNGALAPPFGVNAFDLTPFASDGTTDSQAGGHPYELGTTVSLNNVLRVGPEAEPRDTSVHDVRDVIVDLPLGLVGSALSAPTCTLMQLSTSLPDEGALSGHNPHGCPATDTRVGHILTEPDRSNGQVNSQIFNVTPERGTAAELGFADITGGTHVLHVGVAPTPGGYVLRTTTSEVPQVALDEAIVNFFGNPAARDHSTNIPVAQLTNPSNCSGGPLVAAIHVDSWQNPGRRNPDGTPDFSDPNWASATTTLPPVTGCNQLQFTASIGAQPETTQADTPTGFQFELKVPQNEDPSALATPPLRKAVVTLPVGMNVNPSAAGGLAACSPAQIALGSSSQPSCPAASKIGAVEVETPALAGILQGSVYLATQNENPFHALLAGYIVVDDPTTGVLVKIPGRFEPDLVTGQITATFDESPQLPFSDLKVHFFGGPRATLTTPAGCGAYTTSAQLTPWSAPDSGPPANASDSFQINTGCSGGFNPMFTAGTTSNQAGAFSPLTTTFSRTDQDQNLAGVTLTTPPGLLGILKGIERCPEPQANQGTCGQGSLIGHTTAAVGAGPDPFWVQGGQVFLTGPYKGAPFGLSIVVPAVAGPFNLGNVIVRAAINVDPHTAQITVTSDPLPTILQGIPLDIRTVNVSVDRPGFIFNPTSCEPLAVNAVLSSTQGATARVSSRFQAANCQSLPFKPSFKVSTQAKTSKKGGASLDVKVGYPSGVQANIAKVAVTLPKQLPSRLTTIQQACTEAAFNTNPASCPAGSNIGIATASTPVLASPLVGPAYLVSHGGAAFPDLVIILQGEGVTLDLVGSIDIKHGVTSSAFNSVPDAPINTFELSLPEGPHSALATNIAAKAKGNLCGTTLTMPTTITGQNGAQIKQSTKITVTGCSKVKKKARHKHKKGKK